MKIREIWQPFFCNVCLQINWLSVATSVQSPQVYSRHKLSESGLSWPVHRSILCFFLWINPIQVRNFYGAESTFQKHQMFAIIKVSLALDIDIKYYNLTWHVEKRNIFLKVSRLRQPFKSPSLSLSDTHKIYGPTWLNIPDD